MNIFYLDHDPVKCAQYLCDKHVVKMVLETAQILSAVHHKYQTIWAETGEVYKETHKNHPSTLWAGRTRYNYRWTVRLFKALLKEYTHRYKKEHACTRLLKIFEENHTATVLGKEIPPQCMPDEYKGDDTVEAYRNYYRGEKAGFAKYTNRAVPEFMKDVVEDK